MAAMAADSSPAVVGLCTLLRPQLASAFDMAEADVENALRQDHILAKLRQFAAAVPKAASATESPGPRGHRSPTRTSVRGSQSIHGAHATRKSLEGSDRRSTRQSTVGELTQVRVRSSQGAAARRRLPLLFYRAAANAGAADEEDQQQQQQQQQQQHTQQQQEPELTASLGDVVPVTGPVVCVLRSRPATEPLASEDDVVVCQVAGGANLLHDIRMVLSDVLAPALEPGTAQAVSKFAASLQETTEHVHAQVVLQTSPPEVAGGGELDEAALLRASANPRVLTVYEDVVERWCSQVERVLKDETGLNTSNPKLTPASELRYWNRRMVRLTSLEQQLSTREAHNTSTVLKLGESARLGQWRGVFARLVEAGHEARDNVKYLSAIEASFEPLATPDPQALVDAIPGAIRCVGWLSSLARYYNTSERLTVLLLRVANQLVLTLRAYIGSAAAASVGLESDSLWDLRAADVLARMDAAAWVHQSFHTEYDRAKDEGQFQFNEATIFSRFDAFAQRVADVRAMLTTITQFQALEAAPLDQHSLEPMADRLRLLLVQLRRQGRHPLDVPDAEFTDVQALFQHSCAEMDRLIHSSLATSLAHISSTERALRVMADLSKLPVLRRPALQDDVHLFYERLFEHYSQDLDKVKLQYETFKDHPPCPRNMPPVAGAVAWARQLYRCIHRPMELFEQQNEQLAVMHTSVARHTIRLYNRIAGTLVAFETGFVDKWCEAVVHSKAGLAATLLVRHPASGELFVNFDPQIQRFAREAAALRHLDVELPAQARFLVDNISIYRGHFDSISFVLKERARLLGKIDPLYADMLGPHLAEIDVLLEPGLAVLTWSSLSVPSYISSVRAALRGLEDVVDKANDILSRQITAGLGWIAATELMHVPVGELMTLDEFVERAELRVAELAPQLEAKSAALETAAQELVALITASYKPSDVAAGEAAGQRLVDIMERRTLAAVQECILAALRSLRRRLSSGISGGFIFLENPLFQVDVQLKIPTVVVSPSLDEVQAGVVKMSKSLLSTAKHVSRWGGGGNMFDFVGRSRSIIKVVIQLTGTFHGLRQRVEAWVATFVTKYDFLWRNDVEQLVDEFAEGSPTLDDFENSISKLQTLLGEIDGISPCQNFESLALQTGVLKRSLAAEAMRWKHEYGKALSTWAQAELADLVRFIGETEAQLQVDTGDLDGVASVMTSLAELRDMESEIDLKIAPILDAQAVLNRYQVQVPAERSLDDVLLQWRRLKELAQEVAAHLQTVQPQLKDALLRQMAQFADDVEQLKVDWTTEGPITPGISTSMAMTRLSDFKQRFDAIERKRETYDKAGLLFGLPQARHVALDKIRREIRLLSNLLSLFSNVTSTLATYRATLWIDLDFDKVHAQLSTFQTQCARLPKATKHWDAYRELTTTLSEFAGVVPLLAALSHRSIVDRHWRALERLTGHHFSRDLDAFTLAHALEAPLVSFQEEIEDMCSSALKESEVETSLAKIKDEWIFQNFEFADYHGRGLLALDPRHTAELVTRLDDSQVLLGALLSSRYNDPFKRELLEWLRKLTNVHETVERWLEVQALWMYLEAVFSGGDIARQLPLEAKRFHSIDSSWCKLMAHSSAQANALTVCDPEGALHGTLPFLTEQMEVCQKSLAGYLEAKRNLFPRFNFVSDPVLLEILGQGSDPVAIQPHLGSLFANIVATSSPKNEPLRLAAMHSAEGETVGFAEPVAAEGHVEDWLERLELEMQRTIHEVMRDLANSLFSLDDDTGRLDWVPEYPAQCCQMGLKLLWTHDVTRALMDKDRSALSAVWRKTTAVLNALVQAAASPDMTPVERKKQEALITVQVHNRDVLDKLMQNRVRHVHDFEWLKQMRAYYDQANGHAFAYNIADVHLDYRYEYIGCQDRLVITPLTDRCYITLAQAIAMHLGGSPIGPAGTGKTETVKDMGHALGQFVVVFNCSDQMSSSGLGRVFRGLAQAGVWGDFDEFNRISVPVLSVAAQQIGCVFNALRDYALQSAFTPNMRRYDFKFTDGNPCRLKVGVGIFVTMNPGYAGRQELPENLKALFRMVSMMVPDRDIIARVRLAASGFLENELLSAKLDSLYALCQQQLSKQVHYDFGLRSILSVLRALAPARRALAEEQEATLRTAAERALNNGTGDGSLGQISRPANALAEVALFLKVVKDMNLPKLIAEDETRFLQLLADLFPASEAAAGAAGAADTLPAELREQAGRLGVSAPEEWLHKLCCIWEVSCVRWGLMLLGPSRSAKSTALKVVRTAKGIHEAHINPKALSTDLLFGRLHPATQDWTDGCLSHQWRKASALESRKGEATWLVLDGPVDAEWIENLNTVLDDNRMLSLANGDRLKMPPKLRLVFEVGSLDNASPATISRCGMVYMDSATLSWRQVIEAWSWGCVRDEWASREEMAALLQLCFAFVPDALHFVRAKAAAAPASGLVHALLVLLRATPFPSDKDDGDDDQAPHDSNMSSLELLRRRFTFCLTWSFGVVLDDAGRRAFHEWMAAFQPQPLPPAAQLLSDPGFYEGMVFEDAQPDPLACDGHFCFDVQVDAAGRWQPWLADASPQPALSPAALSRISVPTVETERLNYLAGLLAPARVPVLLVGEPGSGKTWLSDAFVAAQDRSAVLCKTIGLCTDTQPEALQHGVVSLVDKRIGNSYGASGQRRLRLFVDDVNLPAYNAWGDQPTNEALRQMVEQQGFYSVARPGEWLHLDDVFFVAAMRKPGGLEQDIPARVKGRFVTLHLAAPSAGVIEHIYGFVVQSFFHRFSTPVQQLAQRLPALTATLWGSVKDALRPSPVAFHYQWTLAHVGRVFEGLLRGTAYGGPGQLLSAWKHEVNRVMADQLLDQGRADWTWFQDYLRALLLDRVGSVPDDEYFTSVPELSPATAMGALVESGATADENDDEDDGGDDDDDDDEGRDGSPGAANDVPPYRALHDLAALQPYLADAVVKHNGRRHAQHLDMVIFKEVAVHVVRLVRVLRNPTGHALLIGVGGSGKRSLVHLSASLTDFALRVPRTNTVGFFMEDLKDAYVMAGLQGVRVALLVTDADAKNEAVLSVLSHVMAGRDVAGLFVKEELDTMLLDLRAAAEAVLDSFDEIGAAELERFFADRLRRNLRVVLCASPTGPLLRHAVRTYPALLAHSTIDWVHRWPQSALLEVARSHLGPSPAALAREKQEREAAARRRSRQPSTASLSAGQQQHQQQSPRRPHGSPAVGGNRRRPARRASRSGSVASVASVASSAAGEAPPPRRGSRASMAPSPPATEQPVVEDEHERAVAFMAEAHTVTEEACEEFLRATGKHRYVTPRVFLMLVDYFKRVHEQQRRRLQARATAVSGGLAKLSQAEVDIQRMGEELVGQEAELRAAGLHLTALVEEIRTQTATAERAKVEVLGVRERLASEAAELEAVVAEVQTELDRATPALEQALAALNSISSNDIVTLKKLGKPPNLIRRIMDGVLLLCRERILPVQPDPDYDDGRLRPSWANARDMMSDPRFLERLVMFPKDELNAETVELLEPYLNMPDFNFESALHSSGNVAGVCTWVRAMVTYYHVAKEVAPKRQAVYEEQARLDAKRVVLAQAQAELEEKQAALDESTAAYEAAVAEKQHKEADLVTTRSTLERARSLVRELGGEQERWRQQLGEFEATLVSLPGDALLAAAFMSYASGFSQEMRARMLASWRASLERWGIPSSPELDLVAFMVDDATAMRWGVEGLPSDVHSKQNGLYTSLVVASGMRRGGRPPLLLDPQGQGREWISRREGIAAVSAPTCARLAAKGAGADLSARIVDHMMAGRALMVVDLGEELDPALDPLLERKHIVIKGKPHLVIGDREVPVEDGFRLYLATRLANPHFTPEVAANTTMIEFGVTPAALEEQLLAVVIANERADLEVQRVQLQEEIAEHRGKSQQLAAELLQRLASAQGNLLDDNELIEVLARTKTTAMQVEAKVASAEAMRETLMVAYQEYSPVAERGSTVFFQVSSLAKLSHMYQISLPRFIQIFTGALAKAQRVASVQRRVGSLLQHTTYELLQHALSGLFERHKQTLVLSVALALDPAVRPEQYEALVEGNGGMDGGSDEAKMTPMQRLLFARRQRPDRCMAAASEYVQSVLGFATVTPLDLKAALDVCSPDVPVLYLLSRGADPLATVADLAKQQKRALAAVSLGQGQERLARQAVTHGMAEGQWVLLQNGHLALDLMEELATLVDDPGAAPGFRLMLTVQPDDAFPLALLQKCVRLTTEPPRGVRAGLARHFAAFGQDDLDAVHSSAWRQLLFTLAFMHTCVVERRKYGPLGFSVAYDFSPSDLTASVACARSLMEASSGDMDWVAARYLISEVLAGGCVTHENDREVMKAYGRAMLSQAVFMPDYQLHSTVVVPDFPVIEAYAKFVDALPPEDHAGVFRLSPAADYIYELRNTNEVLGNVKRMQGSSSSAVVPVAEDPAVGKDVAAALATELPAPIDEEELQAAVKRLGPGKSMTLFVRDETLALNKLLADVHGALRAVLAAIDGSAILSAAQVRTLGCLVEGSVPPQWAFPGAAAVGAWATAVQRRAEVLSRWLRSGRPRRIALGDLFAPEAFLTALKQDACHAAKKPLDALHFAVSVAAGSTDGGDVGSDAVLLIGLDIEGAAWDERRQLLVDASPLVAVSPMPPLLVQVVAQRRVFDSRVFRCPVYRTAGRATPIFEVPLMSNEDADFWVLRGAALVCSV